jgi:hypothetical protein
MDQGITADDTGLVARMMVTAMGLYEGMFFELRPSFQSA